MTKPKSAKKSFFTEAIFAHGGSKFIVVMAQGQYAITPYKVSKLSWNFFYLQYVTSQGFSIL